MGEGRTVPVSGSGGLVSDGPRLSGTLRPSAGRGKVARTVPVSGWRISTLQGGGSARRFGALESERAQEGESPSVAELPARN